MATATRTTVRANMRARTCECVGEIATARAHPHAARARAHVCVRVRAGRARHRVAHGGTDVLYILGVIGIGRHTIRATRTNLTTPMYNPMYVA